VSKKIVLHFASISFITVLSTSRKMGLIGYVAAVGKGKIYTDSLFGSLKGRCHSEILGQMGE
jgi:hypothetical protein